MPRVTSFEILQSHHIHPMLSLLTLPYCDLIFGPRLFVQFTNVAYESGFRGPEHLPFAHRGPESPLLPG